MGSEGSNGGKKVVEWDTLDEFPPGYKFEPTDEELVKYYLKPKLEGKKNYLHKIHDIDLYDPERPKKCDPDFLAAIYEAQGPNQWYFFTSRDRKYPLGARPNRLAGSGYWKASGADKAVRSYGKIIGYKKTLNFYIGKPPHGIKTNWIMHEFLVDENDKKDPKKKGKGIVIQGDRIQGERNKLDDWVLCRIHYNGRNSGRSSGKKKKVEKLEEEPQHTPSDTTMQEDVINTTNVDNANIEVTQVTCNNNQTNGVCLMDKGKPTQFPTEDGQHSYVKDHTDIPSSSNWNGNGNGNYGYGTDIPSSNLNGNGHYSCAPGFPSSSNGNGHYSCAPGFPSSSNGNGHYSYAPSIPQSLNGNGHNSYAPADIPSSSNCNGPQGTDLSDLFDLDFSIENIDFDQYFSDSINPNDPFYSTLFSDLHQDGKLVS